MSAKNKTVIEGKYTDAIVFLPEEELEDSAYKQIQAMVNHPAFRNPVRVMPDGHKAPNATVGFTMPLTNRVCPNTVGSDINCGMYAVKLSDIDLDLDNEDVLDNIDKEIREVVPMGYRQNKENTYHIKDEFPWEKLNQNWRNFSLKLLDDISLGEYHPDIFTYDNAYFKELCRKMDANLNKMIGQAVTLGDGNHFIELAKDSNGDVWCVIHSGSRRLGHNVANYHQNRAEKIRNMDSIRVGLSNLADEYGKYVIPDVNNLSDNDLHTWVHNKSIVDYEELKDDFLNTDEDYLIDEISDAINGISRKNFVEFEEYLDGVSAEELEDMSSSGDLAYLEGEEAIEYYVDMAFAQMYASESRKGMASRVADVLDAEIVDTIESAHNYIDYEDGIIRKGATPAREGLRAVIPMNMSYGSFIVRGKGNEEANYSAPHGAGRSMSRGQAKNELSPDKFKEQMDGIFASSLPLDEAPDSYKDVEMIRRAMEPMVEVEDRLKPIMSVKAND
jgi:RNA-splicing ligase RtcB